jgi:phage shock protein C
VPNEPVIFVNLTFVRQMVEYRDKAPNGYKLEVFMIDLVKRIQHFFEEHAFGVCTRLGEKMGIATSSIRLFFIYASFLTFGSPIIVYLALAFVMNMRRHLRRRSTIWDY